LAAPVVNVLLSDPVDPGTVYAGANIGVYKSTDGGVSWSNSSDGIFELDTITTMVFDPANSSTLYASGFFGCLYQSTDAGSHWTSSCSDVNNHGLDLFPINSLAIDPVTPTTIYAGGGALDFVSKSTDGGQTWHPSNFGIPDTGSIRTLAIDPASPSTLYAGTSFGIYKSTNGGGDWTRLSSNFTQVLTIDPANPSTIYAGSVAGVLKSTNAGANWTDASKGLSVTYGEATFAPLVFSLAIASTTPETIYAGTRYGGVLKSTDGGANWVPVNQGVANHLVKSLAVNPTTPTTIYAGTDSGTDAFVAEFNPAGSLLSSTYLGGNEAELDNGIAVDTSGNAYITGSTVSLNFPTVNPFQFSIEDTSDGFVSKLKANGSALAYSTYLGGKDADTAQSVAIDGAGSAYVTGQTRSPNFPTTPGAFDATCSTDGKCTWTRFGTIVMLLRPS
jgi:photosystem II stability/assembly factor-like uncharacterized protein